MKKQLALAAGLAVLATPAFATKARLNALGEDQYGSFYVQDNRNMFLNAANVNSYKDFATFEYGGANAGADSINNPQSEGGVFMGHGNLVYGAYFGNKSNTSEAFRSWSGASVNQSNTTDIFVGGDAGIKWGANLSYSNSDKVKNGSAGNTVGNKQNALSTRLGVNGGNWQAFANISLANKAEDGTGNKFKGKTGYQVGGSYMLNDYTLFGEYRSFKGEETSSDTTAKMQLINVGAGRQTKLNDKATLFTKASVLYAKGENDSATNNLTVANDITSVVIFKGDKTTKYTAVPVTAGLEYDAASWLTLRGSVSQILWNQAQFDGDETGALRNKTIVRAGAGLKFGDWNIDGVVGNDNNGSTRGTDTSGGNGTVRTDQLMSRVAVSYKW